MVHLVRVVLAAGSGCSGDVSAGVALLLPFKIIGIAVSGVLGLFWAIALLPVRVLKKIA